MSPRASKTDPQIMELPAQKMAVVRAKGAPNEVFPKIMPALYGAVFSLKFDLKKKGLETFKVGALRARYPDALDKSKKEWTIIAALAVPDSTATLPQKVPGIEVKIETWKYGTVAQILHLGVYDQETASIERLHQLIKDKGYEIAGDHEEEYLTRPEAKVPKTIIRYVVRKK